MQVFELYFKLNSSHHNWSSNHQTIKPKNKYKFSFLFIIILFSNLTLAQNYGVLRGFLTDSLSGESLPYGNIIIKELNEGTASDNQGYFLFPGLPAPGEYSVVVSYVGYEDKLIQARILKNKSTFLSIQLIPISLELQTIEKVVQRIDGDKIPDISAHTFSIKDLENIPQGVETDIIRSIHYLPGVTSTNDVSAKFNVRGGLNNQNLVLLNDATIYNPFHALGMFSIIDPEMINSFDFFKGGFPTEFSGRVSSVINLVAKNGNKNRFSGSASLSLLTAKAAFEGPIPDGSFIITGRQSTSNEVLKKFYNDNNVPVDFYDVSFNLNYANNKFWKDARFIIHGFYSDDKINRGDPFKASYSWKNSIYGISYFQASESPLFYKLSINVSNFDGEVNPNLSNIKPKQNTVRDITYKTDFTYAYPSNDIVDAGLKINKVDTQLYLQNSFGELAKIGPEGATINASIYGKYQLLRFENLGLEAGLRYNFIKLAEGGYSGNPFEPRIRLTYRINQLIRVQASAGVFLQELTTLNNEDEVISIFEPWLILPDYIAATRSTHYILGFDFLVTEYWRFSTEGYYKKTVNLPVLNNNKIFPTDPDLIVAENEAYGAEFLNRLFTKDISFTTSYSLAWVYNEIDNTRYRTKYDTRHSLNLLLEINLHNGWSFSTVWTYKSGIPFTKLIGYYDKYYFNDNPNEFSILNMYSRFTLLDDRNTGQLPDYHRLDLNLFKRIEFSSFKLFIGLSILNVYDRENLFYFNLETGERVNMLPFLPSVVIKAEI